MLSTLLATFRYNASMSNDRLTPDDRLALRSFDLFCSAGRPQRPQPGEPGPDLREVSREELFAAFLLAHPSFKTSKRSVLARLPERTRVHAQWWDGLNKQ